MLLIPIVHHADTYFWGDVILTTCYLIKCITIFFFIGKSENILKAAQQHTPSIQNAPQQKTKRTRITIQTQHLPTQ